LLFARAGSGSDRDRDKVGTTTLAFEHIEELLSLNRELRQEIRERQKIENALRESETRYRLLFENANESVFIAQNERLILINRAHTDLTGYSEEFLLKAPLTAIVHPADRQMVLTRHKRRLAGEQVPNAYVFRIVCLDKTVKWVEINTVGIEWEGKPASLNFLRDITSRKKIEDIAEQVQKMETIGTLAAGIAHKFNNALTGIAGNIDLMKVRMPNQPKLNKYADTIISSVNTMADLNSQLLAYARGGKYQPKRHSLQSLVEDVTHTMQPFTDQQIEVNAVYSADTPDIEVDAVQLKMALQAVLNNAFEAIGNKGTIRICSTHTRITKLDSEAFPGLPEGHYACLCISDNGMGMSEETCQRIFEPFFTTKFIGRGMGMAAVYGIIKNHGGYVYVDSVPGYGTIVSIFLPTYFPVLVQKSV